MQDCNTGTNQQQNLKFANISCRLIQHAEEVEKCLKKITCRISEFTPTLHAWPLLTGNPLLGVLMPEISLAIQKNGQIKS